MSSRQAEKERLRQERLAAERAAARRDARRRRLGLAGGAGALIVAGAVLVAILLGGGSGGGDATASSGLLASTRSEATGQPVNGIRCQTSEQVLFHIHAHLAIYVHGSARTIPQGIGIPAPRTEQQTSEGPFVTGGRCFYWLHSHTADGIVHIESPVQRTYRLGDYFDLWGQPLGPHQVGPAKGAVTAFINGKRVTGNPRQIPLTAHAVIQLDVGGVVRPLNYVFPTGL